MDNKSGLSNYRAISVLSWFSEIFERIMYNQLYQYLTEKKLSILSNLASRRDIRLNMLSCNWLIKFLNLFNMINIPSVFFIDLSKAFDTVSHSILLKKLELYGLTDRNHSWFKNYLSNRKQFIQINKEVLYKKE